MGARGCNSPGPPGRPEDPREPTAKAAAAKGGNKMRTRLASGEKHGRKRMAMLGTVYDAKAAPRTADDVIAPADAPDRTRAPGPKTFNKWLVGSVTDNSQTVISAVFDQAEQRDPDHVRPWVVLVDGARAPIEQILTEAEIRGVTVHIVIDFIHVLEYIRKAAWCFHTAGDAAAEAWTGGHARTILAGQAPQLICDLRTAAKTAGLPADKLETIEKVCGYLENKSPYLQYETALTAGWPIATGIIEGACRPFTGRLLCRVGSGRWPTSRRRGSPGRCPGTGGPAGGCSTRRRAVSRRRRR